MNSSKIKYLDIYTRLKEEIESGRYPVNTLLPTSIELSHIYGVSLQTVQKARRLLEVEGLLKGIPAKGTLVTSKTMVHHYYPKSKTPRIGLLAPYMPSAMVGNTYLAGIVQGMQTEMTALKGLIQIISLYGKSSFEIIREINFFKINGLVTIELEDDKLRKEIEVFSMPMVHLEILDSATHWKTIVANHANGGIIALRKLVELGHRNILYLNVFKSRLNKPDQMSQVRWTGIEEEADKISGLEIHKEDVTVGKGSLYIKEQVADILQIHKACTAIISSLFTDHVKDYFETRNISRARKMDFIFYHEDSRPYLINKKPVWICKTDGRTMGRLAVKTLLDTKDTYPKTQYVPMHLDRNVYTVRFLTEYSQGS
ncbi:MAG: hypothetical protein A2487_10610 [Candidatus Raymondbacteria bacterium RifOxyC12_full_50_8]|uniref:HTH gntR-type domain-containing protein n=1 Tax=Candidatus Raymondbacteria bacterium RIFOXYD12_FULL_49_13 TaxID=1817890 RepID=A0A1F7F138_UNCRA|nr:MAG: hypothetical protein A2248_07900 [Candidatus Raymondbacteria bacterium RIFOXYA2_FULL_49_16]OGJ96588.1 MAG: hypothetical protein A2487_10610 [Candidatus Raymondbacteria bacterium RifOxyC12_full_50_8]OGK00267.1 MAG: hypothetical protein A2519_01275 [Candidatus Raymondbacteria bacterium RIFOXYD12_FULL_49_13]OGK02097.1 MAG: hypothetical protein A2350_21300 [Candidatus Raymondbacteria bacterium RifOxyB12_full_50_8]OGP42326.1 MAG: hypothetical protein A2324_20130 [Candidatus Raymondbacteria b